MLYLENYVYKLESDGEKPERWNCTKRVSHRCPVFLKTKTLLDDDGEESEEIVGVVGVHTHKQENKIVVKKETKKPVAETAKPLAEPKATETTSRIGKKLQTSPIKNDKTEAASSAIATKETENLAPINPSVDNVAGEDEFELDHVYLLVSPSEKQIVCVNGFLYRLGGKSLSGVIFRWECIRHDIGCKARIITECIEDNRHMLLRTHDLVIHEAHEPHATRLLANLISKGKMRLVEDGSAISWLKFEGERIESASTSLTSTRDVKAPPSENATTEIVKMEIQTPPVKSRGALGKKTNQTVSVESSRLELSSSFTSNKSPVKRNEIKVSTKSNRDGEFEHNHVYLLVNNNGRQIICVNGFLYRLGGKSQSGSTFRWECIRSDVRCKTRIYTERDGENCYVLRETNEPATHEHEAYTSRHLSKLISRQRMHLVDDGSSREWLEVEAEPSKCKESNASPMTNDEATNVTQSDSWEPTEEELENSTEEEETEKSPTAKKKKVFADDKIKKHKEELERDHVYLLMTKNNREIICVNGHLYRLEGVSESGALFRWECIRSDVSCIMRIYTERFGEQGYQLRESHSPLRHKEHEPYPPRHLSKLILKHYLRLIDDGSPKNWLKLETRPTTKPAVPPPKPRIKRIFDKHNFVFLPSAKGNRIVCVDNMIYQRSNKQGLREDRSYWTCKWSRNKRYRCNARLVLEETKEGLQIRKMSGDHEHPESISKADKRHLKAIGRFKKSSNSKTENEAQGSDAAEDDNDNDEDYFPTVERVDCSVEENYDIDMLIPEITEELTNDENDDEASPRRLSKRLNLKRKRAAADSDTDDNESTYKMDTTKISLLRSYRGRKLLCVDDFVYYMARETKIKTTWVCIKKSEPGLQCRSILTTVYKDNDTDFVVDDVKRGHNHPVCERDTKLRLYNEVVASGAVSRKDLKFSEFVGKSLAQVKKECQQILSKAKRKEVQEEEES